MAVLALDSTPLSDPGPARSGAVGVAHGDREAPASRFGDVDAPEPLLPNINPWPTIIWVSVCLVILIASLVHAGARRRWGWMIGMVIVPLGVAAYWIAELLRPSSSAGRGTSAGQIPPISR